MSKEPLYYDPFIRELIFLLKFKEFTPELKGSASQKNQMYFSDYDFFTLINKKYTITEIYDEILKILINVKKHCDLYFIELKIEMKQGDKIKFYKEDILKREEFEKIDPNNIDFIKIDFVSRTDNKFIDVSCIYKFDTKPYNEKNINNEMKKTLKADMEEYKNDGNYYKALKREYKIHELNGNEKQMSKLSSFFNSEVGRQYKIMNNLKSIKTLIDNGYNDAITKKKIKLNLKELNIPYTSLNNLDKYIETINKNINDETKKLFFH